MLIHSRIHKCLDTSKSLAATWEAKVYWKWTKIIPNWNFNLEIYLPVPVFGVYINWSKGTHIVNIEEVSNKFNKHAIMFFYNHILKHTEIPLDHNM